MPESEAMRLRAHYFSSCRAVTATAFTALVVVCTFDGRSYSKNSSSSIYISAQQCHPEQDDTDGVCDNGRASLVELRVGLEWFTNPDHLPFVVAEKHGFFRDFGLSVELVAPTDHWEAEEEIIAGRLDVAVTEPLHLAQDASKGKPVLGFSRFLHTDGGVMYQKNQGIERPQDMCGKTISYPGSPGKGGPAIVNTMVKADGMDNCSVSSYGKYNGGFFHTDALESGKADIATLIFWNFEIPEARARGMEVDFFSLKDWGVPDFCQLVLFTTPEKFKQMKDALRRLVLAMRRATGVIHQQPELAASYFNEYVSKAPPKAVMDSTLPSFPNDNSMSLEYYERLMAWLVDTDQVDADQAKNTSVQSYWTNEIAW